MRPIRITTGIQKDPFGSVLIATGETKVICAASVSNSVPAWLAGQKRGWVTAEYAMLPGAVPNRGRRSGGGRAKEIQRLIGRSLRAAINLEALGERLITIDCDVLQADGGTRVASITGGWVALSLAIKRLLDEGQLQKSPLVNQLSAVSCVIHNGQCLLDPDYVEDSSAEVDANFVMTSDGNFVEIQSTAEGKPFTTQDFSQLLELAQKGATEMLQAQNQTLAEQ
jgi:ribonuclease PH